MGKREKENVSTFPEYLKLCSLRPEQLKLFALLYEIFKQQGSMRAYYFTRDRQEVLAPLKAVFSGTCWFRLFMQMFEDRQFCDKTLASFHLTRTGFEDSNRKS
ncbi:hypothetical protein A2533_03555 [Candidatus Falkowbacteria bacterium RIFOXYD2_FULL_35_9]|uniref:Uncharacterized protein n=1 Tax=Candidatus Falkowbacteria bacterium RIFOXYC2_FULL_36_12 TaxID=1798002 RepID=A0A1F5T0G9_9BACT|nr:MAG: hypothetical protein A2300_01475 [Candidatus Falkowbacteria bacterium RIFOXYB2_FULL_35_7]OGF32409.1 MAG: hypothetical protein A2478_03760 [Candidatus Falkowbacteria bacterium RIFOXYC2_FULL_36_12]OGF34017.1 MAG: hypothetical protein A2223_03815 [Candidatus Falkowbacteria bacterium RIFOXYA2_FULL_35_8]OGF47384.1 MAG: hypothetical protein A2533_03555 [Candidatus Falkowbacteria bacterium RIFOXYD2_FULL_35_9]